MLTEADVVEALRVCFDPELPVNIVDLGLVYRVAISTDPDAPGLESRFRVAIALTMRARSEEREPMLLAQVANRLAGLREISRTEVKLIWEPAWTPERMSDAARRQLGLDKPASVELVQIRLA